MNESQNKPVTALAGILLICVIVAGLAGTIASVFTQESLRQYIESLTRRESIGRLSEVQPRTLPGTYEEALTRVKEQAMPSVAILRSKTTDSLAPERWISEQDAATSGVVVTSDGWILFSGDVAEDWKNPVTDAEVWIGGERYSVEHVLSDVLTNVVLVKVTGANLPAIAFGESSQMLAGQIVFSVMPSTTLATSVVRTDMPVASVVSAEQYATRWIVKDDVAPSFLVNGAGEMVAFTVDAFEAIPMDHLLPFIQSALRQKSVVYAGIGVTVVDISAVANLTEEAKMGETDGALVIGETSGVSAFVKNGPATTAGLKLYDVITAVNGVPVTHESSLALLLKSYAPGDQINLSVVRAGSEMEIPVTLGDYAKMLY